jgi:AmiR/NasT family two-component response regulator
MNESVELADKLLDEGSVEGLVQALDGRVTIGLGMGIAMERHQLDEDQAMQFLVFEAANHAVSLHEAARRLVEGCNAESEQLDPHGLAMRRVTRFPRSVAGRTA